MGTRGAILRAGLENEMPTGRYHHWDSYPSGLGATLFEAIRGHFKGDIKAALAYLIDDHPAGWSTINGKDLSISPGYEDWGDGPCTICGRDGWAHYKQNYQSRNVPLPPEAAFVKGFSIYGHAPEEAPSFRPLCYCHGSRSEEGWDVTLENAAGSGCEYAYVISPETRTMYVLSSYSEDGTKMVGMFGIGDDDATWRELAKVDLDGPEPDWKKMQGW